MSSTISFEIKIVYDNRCHEKGFLTSFGFSALIYNNFTGNYVLFDTGTKSDLLTNNIQRFNVESSNIKKVIIPHSHLDHAGCLREIYVRNPSIEVYVPIGGFHGFRKFSYLKDIEIIAACHYRQYVEEIKTRFPEQYKKICVGQNLIF